ncbi:MAG TPA: sugar phosphate nucleotidyltransferase [Myxococcales bacterium]|nr:sugar phosphate nucleotidyltransferase [Myxococcales bacterium]
MKVVLFCGGLGMRLRDYSERIPKPLVEVGNHPILWHLMKYYAHFGHKEFILCLGHGAQAIKTYFRTYDECLANDFVLQEGGRKIDLLRRDIDDWRITFADTGINSNIGQRLMRVRQYLGEDREFLANYADGLADLDLDRYLDYFHNRGKIATMVSIPAPHTFHVIEADGEDQVRHLQLVSESKVRVNGGFFAFRREIFDYIREGEELVIEPFARLSREHQLLAYPFDGFWRNMDTFKDKMALDEICAKDRAPWQVWKKK